MIYNRFNNDLKMKLINNNEKTWSKKLRLLSKDKLREFVRIVRDIIAL